jgi:hypothetical protein
LDGSGRSAPCCVPFAPDKIPPIPFKYKGGWRPERVCLLRMTETEKKMHRLSSRYPSHYSNLAASAHSTVCCSQAPAICSSPEPDKFSLCLYYISWGYILILSSHLRVGLPSDLFPSGIPNRILYCTYCFPSKCKMPRPSHSSLFVSDYSL